MFTYAGGGRGNGGIKSDGLEKDYQGHLGYQEHSFKGYCLVWYAIVYYHGDLEPDHLPANQEKVGWVPCVWQINNFASVFLFSVETQHTIGMST